MATHSNILAWWIPWTEEPGGLQSMGSQGVGYDWSNWTHTHKPEGSLGKTQGEGSCLRAKERSFSGNQPCCYLDSQPPGLWESKFLLLKPLLCGALSWQPDQTVMRLKTLCPRVLWLRDWLGRTAWTFLLASWGTLGQTQPPHQKETSAHLSAYPSLLFFMPHHPAWISFFFFFPVWISKSNMLAILQLKDGSSLFWGENASPNPIRGDCLFHVQALNSTLCHNPSKFFCHNKSFPMPPEQCSKVSHICYWLITR